MSVMQIQSMSTKAPPSLYLSLIDRANAYHFCYPERRNTDIHESHSHDKTLLTVRIIALLYLSAIYAGTLYEMPTLNTNIIYLTMIGYTLTWLYFMLSLQHYLFKTYFSPQLTKIIEVIYELAFCAQVPITIVFWTLLFKYVVDAPDVTTGQIFLQSNLHAAPLIFLTLDTIFNSFQFHVRHVIFLIFLTIIYLIINMIYSLMVKPIYPPLPWNNVTSYILALGCIVAVIAVHFAARVGYRKWKLQKLKEKDDKRNPQELRESLIEEGDGRISFEKFEGSDKGENSVGRRSLDL